MPPNKNSKESEKRQALSGKTVNPKVTFIIKVENETKNYKRERLNVIFTF